MKKSSFYTGELILAMCLFGTLSLFVKPVQDAGMGSGMIVWIRAVVGVLSLLALHLIRREKFDLAAIRRRLPLLIFSGTCMAFNWILLFEAYKHTTVSVATVCYYTAPIIFMIGTFFFFKERVSPKKIVCIVLALAGMFLVSFDFSEGFVGMTGVFCALGAAILYATVILLNKYTSDISGPDRTFFQLLVCVAVVLPYVLLTGQFSVAFEPLPIVMLLTLGILHTGVALSAYFASVGKLSSTTVTILSYLDPLVAVLLSIFVFRDQPTLPIVIGIVLIIGASVWSELPDRKKKEN